ncbi:MAG: ABC-type protease/lipase transport system ATPase and permease component [Rhodospirillaceae bacterium]|nr:MAG: ABC-type protease/lipase transport system ATPase and permease component [Rhodospirillaceae bacterium]
MLAAPVGTAFMLSNRLRDALKNRLAANEHRFNFIIEVLGGIHTVQFMAMEAQILRRYERLQETCAKGNYQVTLHSASAFSLSTFFS